MLLLKSFQLTDITTSHHITLLTKCWTRQVFRLLQHVPYVLKIFVSLDVEYLRENVNLSSG